MRPSLPLLDRAQVGRKWKEESFTLLALPELRGVLLAVLEQLQSDPSSAAVELLKPFKMAHVSPRVFWNMVHHAGGDVAAGLRQLLPAQDWHFLDERDKRLSDKAAANHRQAEAERQRKAELAAARKAKAAAKAAAGASASGDVVVLEEEAAPEDGAVVDTAAGEAEDNENEEQDEQGEEECDEPAEDDPDGWEARGRRAMLRDNEYDYACMCLNRALLLRIDAAGDDHNQPALAEAWYLHGSALLRRAQAMRLLLVCPPESSSASAVSASAPSAPSPSNGEFNRISSANGAAGMPASDLSNLGDEWQRTGSAAIGRRVRRFFALHGTADGTVVAWQPPVAAPAAVETDEAVWHVIHDDGDGEDLEADELDDALEAAREDRTLEQEVELVMEAAWEALEMAVALYAKQPEANLQQAQAHERLGDAALQNEQPERALHEYGEARLLLGGLRDAGALPQHDRRVADVEFYLGVTQLQLGALDAAKSHYRQAVATLKLRRAHLQRASLDAQIAGLEQQVEGGGGGDGGSGNEAAEAEVGEITELVQEIEVRLQELHAEE